MEPGAPGDRAPSLLAVVAAAGLPGAERTEPVRLDAPAAEALIDAAEYERLTGHLGTALRTGLVVMPDGLEATWAQAHHRALATCVRVERTLVETAAVLDRAGVASAVLKGPALAHLDYPDPAVRTFGDLDLLVGRRLAAAVTALEEAGGHPEATGRWEERFAKAVAVTWRDGTEVDVHRSFAEGRAGQLVDAEALLRAARPDLVVGGVAARVPPPPARLLLAALQCALTRARPWNPARDLAQLVLVGGVPVGEAVAVGGAALEPLVAAGVRVAWQRLGLPPHDALRWAASVLEPGWVRRELRAAQRSTFHARMTGVHVQTGPVARVRYALPVAGRAVRTWVGLRLRR